MNLTHTWGSFSYALVLVLFRTATVQSFAGNTAICDHGHTKSF
jgi:hypothetical protein